MQMTTSQNKQEIQDLPPGDANLMSRTLLYITCRSSYIPSWWIWVDGCESSNNDQYLLLDVHKERCSIDVKSVGHFRLRILAVAHDDFVYIKRLRTKSTGESVRELRISTLLRTIWYLMPPVYQLPSSPSRPSLYWTCYQAGWKFYLLYQRIRRGCKRCVDPP